MIARARLWAVAACFAMAGAGCALYGPPGAPDAPGAFRAQWWNHYQRGAARLDAGDTAGAERDLRLAIAGRGGDQLWPRTYGLHFLPEYFPHRERGIALLGLGRIDEAIAELEASLDQRASARAAYYLGEARRRQIAAAGGDLQPPVLRLRAAGGVIRVGKREVLIAGDAGDDHFVSMVRVSGRPCGPARPAREHHFEAVAPLQPGANAIQVEAVDLAGNRSTTAVEVTADWDGPSVTLSETLLIGLAYDPAGVASMELAGGPLPLTPLADGSVQFAIPSEAARGAGLAYRCTDALGNATAGYLGAPPVRIALADNRPMGWAAMRALLAQADSAVAPLEASIVNVAQDSRIDLEEIVVVVEARGAEPIAELLLNEMPIETGADRKHVRASRRIRLAEGENVLHLTARGRSGAAASHTVRCVREPRSTDTANVRLGIALLNASIEEADSAYAMGALEADALLRGRFKVVARDLVEEMLAEQELSSHLASREQKLALGRLVPADLLIQWRMRRDQQSVELVLDAASTETGVRVASHLDVAGPAEALDQLIGDLALRLVQEFPRVTGRVIGWSPPEIVCDLTARQRIHEDLRCVVFRTETVMHPASGLPLGERPIVIAEAHIRSVSDQFSTAELLADGGAGPAALPIEIGQFVVTK